MFKIFATGLLDREQGGIQVFVVFRRQLVLVEFLSNPAGGSRFLISVYPKSSRGTGSGNRYPSWPRRRLLQTRGAQGKFIIRELFPGEAREEFVHAGAAVNGQAAGSDQNSACQSVRFNLN